MRRRTKRAPAQRFISPYIPKHRRMKEAPTATGMSLRTVPLATIIGATEAAAPAISSTLNMLLPTTFATARSVVPRMAEVRLTNNSGIEVPRATTVSPMTISGIPAR